MDEAPGAVAPGASMSTATVGAQLHADLHVWHQNLLVSFHPHDVAHGSRVPAVQGERPDAMGGAVFRLILFCVCALEGQSAEVPPPCVVPSRRSCKIAGGQDFRPRRCPQSGMRNPHVVHRAVDRSRGQHGVSGDGCDDGLPAGSQRAARSLRPTSCRWRHVALSCCLSSRPARCPAAGQRDGLHPSRRSAL